MQRLYAFQHEDGGWGWWYDDPSDGYQTAWVVFGLAVTAERGYPVDFGVLERGGNYLKAHLDEMPPPTRAFALYAMAVAGYGDLERTLDQTASLHDLDLFSQASLALALQKLGEETIANELLDEILLEVRMEADGDVWVSGARRDGYYDQKFMASDVRTTAMVLRAVLALQPNSELRPGMVQWLQTRRTLHGWGTTNETAFTLLALTDHLLAQQSQAVNSVVSIFLNDGLLVTGTLSAENLSMVVEVPVAALQTGANEIRLETTAASPLYYTVSSEMYVGKPKILGEGLAITRTYLDPETKEPVTTVREGDLVLVRLTVNLPAEAFYLMLTDHLPGGLEALNEGLNINGRDTAVIERMYWDYRWDWFSYDDYGYNNKEIWPDRVLFFVTQMSRGQQTFDYYARATVSGAFTALPAEIEAMYEVNVWGRSASETLTVLAALSGQSATQKVGGLVD